MPKDDISQICNDLRAIIKNTSDSVIDLKNNELFAQEQAFKGQHSEMIANVMLSYRHLEDARMRLGKVLQQLQGGVSIFDREKEPDQLG